jgi:hypothetical protein
MENNNDIFGQIERILLRLALLLLLIIALVKIVYPEFIDMWDHVGGRSEIQRSNKPAEQSPARRDAPADLSPVK